MGTLIPEVAALGLAVALTSPGSVITVIALLTMSNGLRRAIAFICGWILGIGVLAVLMIFVFHGQDFSSRPTTPSRTASAIEVVLGFLLVIVSFRALPPAGSADEEPVSAQVVRPDRPNTLGVGIVVGAFMLSFALTVAAIAEILKANVGVVDAAVPASCWHSPRSSRSPPRWSWLSSHPTAPPRCWPPGGRGYWSAHVRLR